ncbi:MAG: thioredoxin [Spirochaetes bacterium GWC1_61_12]|nr:MAG: thioredoxin [Spirochaetes bacterium GWB1_60_80]OHD35455.1 MAG: thioredoxin [Spirochaetes bacterium GWC1_61_12]OHD61517.1 MAG: thioredoxin [Spirochaetes bacterium GWF1_60_12]HAP43245.1 thioredoxin [Spirochaetaceae bacterium]HAW86143.1 thioredoxin [Spirochaetaceae bacterium]
MSNALAVTSASFEAEVEKSTIPVLVDFWAEWCMPCRVIGPHLDELAKTYAGKIKVVKVNVDNEPNLAGRFDIISIPTLIVFKNGQLARQKVGGLPKHEIENLFKDLI